MPSTPKPVEVESEDGVLVRGELVGEGDRWAVLVHDFGADLDTWRPLRTELERADLCALAIDLRGHGASDGEWSAIGAVMDVQAAVRFAREQGARAVYVVGSGQGATAAIIAAGDEPVQAMACLSPRAELDGVDPALLRVSRAPKFLVVGSRDEQAMADAQTVYRKSLGWRVLESRALTEQGTALLEAPGKEHVFEKTVAFFRDY